VAVPADGHQLALPLEPHAAPELRALSTWERMLADYGSTGVTLREHPLELMRPSLGEELVSSRGLERMRNGQRVKIAGLVVARQRPATAHGITFMLLEDEFGTLNLIVPPPVFDEHRAVVRAEPLLMAAGRVENREGTINIVVDRLWRLERPDLPQAEIRHIEPRKVWSTEEDANNLRSVAPVAHSFGRRGR
jgi:error-prone DNA polymerase